MNDKWVRAEYVRHYLIDEARVATEGDEDYKDNVGKKRKVKKVTPSESAYKGD